MEEKMARCGMAICVILSPITLAVLAPTIAAAPQPTAGDDASELKATQEERIKVLTELVDGLTSQYKSGTVEFGQVVAAENELCNALLDATDDPDKRIALLTKQLDRAGESLKVTQARHDAGTVTFVDVARAKSQYLELKIKLLRERSRKKSAAPIAAKRP
jgi:hypothetical protein